MNHKACNQWEHHCNGLHQATAVAAPLPYFYMTEYRDNKKYHAKIHQKSPLSAEEQFPTDTSTNISALVPSIALPPWAPVLAGSMGTVTHGSVSENSWPFWRHRTLDSTRASVQLVHPVGGQDDGGGACLGSLKLATYS